MEELDLMRSHFPRLAAFTAGTALSVACLLPQSVAAQSNANVPCTYKLGFNALVQTLSSDVVGSCLENEYFNQYNGNAEQRTDHGLLYWRKSDNTSAFTDGMTTWLDSSYGIQVRMNTDDPFDWETVGIMVPAYPVGNSLLPAIVGAPSPTAAPPGPSAAAPLGQAAAPATDATTTSQAIQPPAPRAPEITPLIRDSGPVNWRNRDLTNADRRDIDLVNADMYHAKLVGADFSYSRLGGASLMAAEITRAVFFATDLTQVRAMGVFSNSSPTTPGPNFAKALLNNARFSYAKLPYSDFRQADMRDSDFSHAILVGSDMRGAALRHADLSKADLDKVDFTGADLTCVNLTQAHITITTIFRDAKLGC
jgi:hypothetical protein